MDTKDKKQVGKSKFSITNSVCYTELIALLKRVLNGLGT